MYPNLYYFFKDLFGVEWNAFKLINSFGFFVALSFIAAAYVLSNELKRKQKEGLLSYTEQTITVGAAASTSELIINFLLGFVLGFKIIGAFLMPDALSNPQAFLLSMQGNWLIGIVLGGFFCFLKWKEKNKHKLSKPEKRTLRIWSHDRVGDLVIKAAIYGFLGAKFFDILEAPASFLNAIAAIKEGKESPAALLFSGLTFYGGLICAALAIFFYAKKHRITFIHLCDAAAPALMLAYAIGRIGCQVAGDGDWGILNSAFISDANGNIIHATNTQFQTVLNTNTAYYIAQFGDLSKVQHLAVQPFWGLPNWMFGYNYLHNVNDAGIALAGCTGNYCTYLPVSVFPTPFYETVMSLILFAGLWFFRKKFTTAGRLFAVYLFVNGLERFLIEKIRVNATYSLFGFHPTQAEIISFLLMISGAILYFKAPKFFKKVAKA
ncbi:MAG: prolipoprotein diacylglyceryl transferase [Bacteroidetes bacterium]|nr:prolipoprotein diacylglyceryl transferase [Bacteroidota bacterium]